MNEHKYIEVIGIWYDNALRDIRKKDDTPLQPVFEAFTNSLESINILKEQNSSTEKGKIVINLFLTTKLLSEQTGQYDFQKIEISDIGIGFNDKEFERFINLKDNRKGYSNKGTGRIQFLHTFDTTEFTTIYNDPSSKTGFKKRIFTLSKSTEFLTRNAIIRLEEEEETEATHSSTQLVFKDILLEKDAIYFSNLTTETIKEDLIFHYMARFCENRNSLPQIIIRRTIDDKIENELEIISDDIPIPEKEQLIDIYYSQFNNSKIERTSNKETLHLKAFKISKEKLDKNALILISKGEIAKDIKLYSLLPKDAIDDNRYLFLASGKYIDDRDSDTRGDINISTKEDFKKKNIDSLFHDEEILLEDIEDKINNVIDNLYIEIQQKNDEKMRGIQELQKMFLLDPKIISSLRKKININDSDSTILRKVYEVDAKIKADGDANIKQQIKKLEELNTTEKDYKAKLSLQVDEFVKLIPIQNRTALTQYVARRKLVLDLFDKILEKQLEELKKGGRIDEDIMHNLIFQQSSDNPESSDLWLIEETFIYFRGFSEKRLCQIEIDGEKIFKKEFTEEENKYLNSLGEKRLDKRPDVLLFPQEGKCIIIEFKAPDVNVSEHLSQVDFYANLIRNYTTDKFQITTFYGYLIGENIEDRDVRGRVSRFEHSYHFDYWFRPSENVIGFDDKTNGSIYTEVIKYSTFLKRAKLRNKIFIDKLEGH